MADPHTREIGRVESPRGGSPLVVGIDRGMVTLGTPGHEARLTPEAADELAAHLITACWRADPAAWTTRAEGVRP